MQTHEPSPSSVEEIVSQLATLTAQGQSFEFFIPESLTLGGVGAARTGTVVVRWSVSGCGRGLELPRLR